MQIYIKFFYQAFVLDKFLIFHENVCENCVVSSQRSVVISRSVANPPFRHCEERSDEAIHVIINDLLIASCLVMTKATKQSGLASQKKI
ncbi:MAG: hypothetical protein LBF59_10140 [Prevotellaceae bacterium]|nr:hypothetical protein [Prevotellaceae bacterium]